MESGIKGLTPGARIIEERCFLNHRKGRNPFSFTSFVPFNLPPVSLSLGENCMSTNMRTWETAYRVEPPWNIRQIRGRWTVEEQWEEMVWGSGPGITQQNWKIMIVRAIEYTQQTPPEAKSQRLNTLASPFFLPSHQCFSLVEPSQKMIESGIHSQSPWYGEKEGKEENMTNIDNYANSDISTFILLFILLQYLLIFLLHDTCLGMWMCSERHKMKEWRSRAQTICTLENTKCSELFMGAALTAPFPTYTHPYRWGKEAGNGGLNWLTYPTSYLLYSPWLLVPEKL